MPPNPRPSGSPNLLKLPRLYCIVDGDLCAQHQRAPVDVARAFLSAGATLIQVRCKQMASGAFLDLTQTLMPDVRAAGALLIVNDRADVARMADASGLHIGQEDLSPQDARTVIGSKAILGWSTHTPEQWSAAVREPLSYMAVGPAFGSATKATGYEAIGLRVVQQAARVAQKAGLPTVAIGGITLDNAVSVIDAGAASVAVISDLLAGDPGERCRAFLSILR